MARFYKLWSALAALHLVCVPTLGFASNWKTQGWEKINEENGIKVYRKSSPETNVKGVGGEAVIEASVGKILWVLMDHKHKPEWVDKFQSASTLEEISPLVHIQYASFDMPFPVADRDFVYRYEFKVDQAANSVIVEVKSIQHRKAPEEKSVGVRGEIVEGRYILTPRGQNQTLVKAEYLADPKGLLPSWVVNVVQKQWPYKTLKGLRSQVRKPFVQEWDVFEAQLKPKLRLASQP